MSYIRLRGQLPKYRKRNPIPNAMAITNSDAEILYRMAKAGGGLALRIASDHSLAEPPRRESRDLINRR